MWEDDHSPQFREGDLVRWRDPIFAEMYGSGPGPFRVVTSRPVNWAPVCTCDGLNKNLLEGKHRRSCQINSPELKGFAVTVEMNGRYRSFPEEWFVFI